MIVIKFMWYIWQMEYDFSRNLAILWGITSNGFQNGNRGENMITTYEVSGQQGDR